ncbi:sugar ABC transporter ATP-binding protein [Spirillospora sp. NPDC048911]|uniref:sugar ABC transporter ATP-binding protein n=1 Tax=Spirillospora sp. NPDC048911 TaxID=3364527 RepID=UPI003717F178
MLTATGLTKHFGGVVALDDAGIELVSGQVHGLVGENGAGKSTLVKILCGVLRPDAGTITIENHPVRLTDARRAAAHGVAVVSQELMTFGDLIVLENLFPHNRMAGKRELARRAAPVLAELGLSAPPHARVGTLPLADRQLLEICRALLQEPRILVLDEPTSTLPREAVARLEQTIRGLAKRGLAVLYISHYLEDVMRIAQRVTVLRNGRTVLTGRETTKVSLGSLVEAMLGEAIPPTTPTRRPTSNGPALHLTDVTTPHLHKVSLTATAGEIVGLAGLQGAGHLAVFDVICGRKHPTSGQVTLPSGTTPRSFRQAVAAGVAYISGDRKARGLMLDRPVWENLTAVRSLGLGRDGALPPRRPRQARAQTQATKLRISSDLTLPASALSGGNQQKTVLGKWLDAAPTLALLDDPTRGVDVRARLEVHDLIRDLAESGRPVLIASSDLTELTELCHRVLIFQHGQITAELTDATEQDLSLAMNAGFARPTNTKRNAPRQR